MIVTVLSIAGDVKRFHAAVGPVNFQFVHLRRGAQTKVERHIVLRTINRAADHVESLRILPVVK